MSARISDATLTAIKDATDLAELVTTPLKQSRIFLCIKCRCQFSCRAIRPLGMCDLCRRERNLEIKRIKSLDWSRRNPDLKKARGREYAAKNKPAAVARGIQWRKDNPARYEELRKARYAINRDRILEEHREAYAANPEIKKAVMREWVKSNPLKAMASHHRHRTMRRAAKASGNFKAEDIVLLLVAQGRVCANPHCSKILDKYHIDHIHPISRGGTNDRENIQLLCPRCNIRKGDKDWSEFLRIYQACA